MKFSTAIMLILGLNCGSLSKSINNSATTVQTNIHILLQKIKSGYSTFPDIFSVHESGDLNYEIWPRYGGPAATDEHVKLEYVDEAGLTRECRRGVSTYCDKTDIVNSIKNVVPNLEATTTLHDYEDNSLGGGTVVRRLLFMSFYRNTNPNVQRESATLSEIGEYIQNTRKKARTDHKTRSCIIIGDFNNEEFKELENDDTLRELTDPGLFHKHNSDCDKKYIDRIFTNIPSARIAEVFETVENKSNNGEGLLGHKPYLIEIGARKNQAKSVNTTSGKDIRQLGKKWLKSDSITEELYPDTEKGIEDFALELQERAGEIFRKATKTRLRTPRSANQIAIELLNSITDEQINKPKASTSMYGFVEMMVGSEETTIQGKPQLVEFKNMAEKKLANLERPNRNKALEIAKTLWEGRHKVEHHFPGRQAFKNIIKHSSNSNARDIYGMSPRLLKLLIKSSPGAFESFYLLSAKISRVGFIPKCWKRDTIFFLYKRKGGRLDPKNYRPITIAVGFIKIYCKVMMHKWTIVDDLNHRNHAYTAGQSCLTAVIDVMESVRKLSKTAEGRKELDPDYEILPLIFCEDISGAFESIYHDVLLEYCRLNFADTPDFKLAELTKSYLTREPIITDRETGETIDFNKTFEDQTSPQGSSASPPWWRVFDSCITEIYMQAVNKVIGKCEDIVYFDHYSYSDDKLSIIGLKIKKNEAVDTVRQKITVIAGVFKDLLKQATKQMGCKINPDKSEIIVPERYEDKGIPEKDKKLKENFTWLGYSFNLEGFRLNFTRNKMNARLENARRDYRKVFHLIKSTAVRRRVFQVYIRPIIDWYTPVVALNKRTANKKMDPLEKFQHNAQCAVLKCPSTVSRVELNEVMFENSIDTKITLFALRWRYLFTRDVTILRKELKTPSARMKLRSGAVTGPIRWPGADRHDFGDKMVTRFEDTKEIDLELPIPREFKADEAEKWSKNKKREINAKITARLNELFE